MNRLLTYIAPLLLVCGTCTGVSAGESKTESLKIGVVNFADCVTQSKYGKQEQENFEGKRKQMTSLIADREKELEEVTGKFSDPDYMDGLSPEGEQDLSARYQSLREEVQRYQNQAYQILNQANMELVQKVAAQVNAASEKVCKAQGFSLIVNKDACFASGNDITQTVIEAMDRAYDEAAKQAAAAESKKAG